MSLTTGTFACGSSGLTIVTLRIWPLGLFGFLEVNVNEAYCRRPPEAAAVAAAASETARASRQATAARIVAGFSRLCVIEPSCGGDASGTSGDARGSETSRG